MLHYYMELATFILLSYLLGCVIGAGYRKYFGKAAPAAVEDSTTIKWTNPADLPANTLAAPRAPVQAPEPAVVRTQAPVLPPTHPSLPRQEPKSKKSRPRGISAPLGGKADDLQKIVGVGQKYEKVLNNLGFYHFDQIAEWTPEQVDWVDDHLQFDGRIEREKWIDQARLLADGDMAEFKRLYGGAPAKQGRPKGISSARGGRADNLQRISGVGPKNVKLLHELGIFHFDQIAAWSDDEMAWVDSHLKFNGRIEREEWTRQARLLADGNEAEFTRLYGTGGMKNAQGEIKSGSRTRKS